MDLGAGSKILSSEQVPRAKCVLNHEFLPHFVVKLLCCTGIGLAADELGTMKLKWVAHGVTAVP